jgi:hypothetical protein
LDQRVVDAPVKQADIGEIQQFRIHHCPSASAIIIPTITATPDLVERIINAIQPAELSMQRVCAGFPIAWSQQLRAVTGDLKE